MFPTKLALASTVLLGTFGASIAVADTMQAVTVTTPGGPSCAGDLHTVSWSAPSGISDLIGYRVERVIETMSPPITFTTDVAAEQTSLTYATVFGWNALRVYAITSQGVAGTPFAMGLDEVGQPPQPMRWTLEGSSVGDGAATVRFRWPPTVELFTTGGLPNTVRITASPGGASVDVPVLGSGVSATFSGLRNGTAYTFTATVSNACGSSGPDMSPRFTPGVAPTWVRSTPPDTVGPGQYVYNFGAAGDPAPVLSLRNAPAWLSISPKGLVSGRPPSDTSSFSYSVAAANGVGIEFFQPPYVIAGPFTVSVWTP